MRQRIWSVLKGLVGLRESEVKGARSPHSEVRLEPGARYKCGIIHEEVAVCPQGRGGRSLFTGAMSPLLPSAKKIYSQPKS